MWFACEVGLTFIFHGSLGHSDPRADTLPNRHLCEAQANKHTKANVQTHKQKTKDVGDSKQCVKNSLTESDTSLLISFVLSEYKYILLEAKTCFPCAHANDKDIMAGHGTNKFLVCLEHTAPCMMICSSVSPLPWAHCLPSDSNSIWLPTNHRKNPACLATNPKGKMARSFFFTRGAMGPFESMNNAAFVAAKHATLSSNLLVIRIFNIFSSARIQNSCQFCVCVFVHREIEREKEKEIARCMYVDHS